MSVTQAPRPLPPKHSRRSLLRRLFNWSAAAVALSLLYPLLKYTRFRVKPKPRYVTVNGPLPLSGYHAERDFILFADSENAVAVSRTCTHLGCRVNFLEDQDAIECPCHQSRFTRQGKRITGPAEKDLPSYAVEIKKDAAGVTTQYVVELI
ncbi:ubiquinol-cytochrome c reductase iron-sulfur subunit [Desulfogranum marinum]|uniref:ubiquinol-cytochrome c reductase iron-sulfur subunit n=1 Tax=Desulfogranum marinum TaxID=453220 RepID=UPI001965A17D|nr:ubiquinol-cytochrome c reductase iron-sulfur subunit [Desulfogranum marinum]MBM9510879.1 ubiquinol-cytochrome c reductase iron-sulfur subunit [Desulfogranum marinum]